MKEAEDKNKLHFSVAGAWLGLIAYLVVIILLAIVWIVG